jgi:NAD(P)-dependent dehydrogenase (short-subunit alcohol dehydrogenase family)
VGCRLVSDLQLDVTGRRALVTGAGQGLGAAIATTLARAGASVLVNDIDQGRAESVAASIRAAGGDASVAGFDVTVWGAVRQAIAAAPRIDILVNNAGNAGTDAWPGLVPLAESDPVDWEPFLRVNLYGVMHCTRAVLPAMIDNGWGRIVTVLSDAARTGEPLMAAYSAAKAGAAGFCRSVAREVGRHGVTANCVALGTMRASAEVPLNPVQERAMRRYPIGRTGLPDDVTTLVTLLASDAGEWITGQTIPVNGGLSFAL